MTANTLNDFRVGQRVELAPHTDEWMRGARYGVVVSLGRKLVKVKLDHVRTPLGFWPSEISS